MTVVAPEWAADLIGIPFKDRGRDHSGADCWGVLRLALMKPQFGVELPLIDEGYAGTEREDGPQVVDLIREELARGSWHPVAKGKERSGDGILMRFNGYPMHVGVVLVPGLGLSSISSLGSYVLRYREILTKDTVLGFYRHADLMGEAHG